MIDKIPVWCNEDALRKYRFGETITGFKKMFLKQEKTGPVTLRNGSVLSMVDLPPGAEV